MDNSNYSLRDLITGFETLKLPIWISSVARVDSRGDEPSAWDGGNIMRIALGARGVQADKYSEARLDNEPRPLRTEALRSMLSIRKEKP